MKNPRKMKKVQIFLRILFAFSFFFDVIFIIISNLELKNFQLKFLTNFPVYSISLDGANYLKRIWYPVGCFINSKSATIHRSPLENTHLIIYSNGKVRLNYRIKLAGPCVSSFKSFPVDYQRCSLAYESYAHNRDRVQFNWNSEYPVRILKEMRLPEFNFKNYTTFKIIKVSAKKS